MKVDGGCHCGRVKFEAEVDPNRVTLCHCTDCQRLSGSAYRANIAAVAGSFKILSGAPKIYVKTAENGQKSQQAFCDECGAEIYARGLQDPDVYGLRVGTIAQRQQLSPRRQIWRRSALPWVDNLGAVPMFEQE